MSAASGAASGNSRAGDPTEIDKTIAQMKCTVCRSQRIISKALDPKYELKACNVCRTSAAPAAAAPAASPVAAAPSPAAASSSSVKANTNNKNLDDYLNAKARGDEKAADAVLERNTVTNSMAQEFMQRARNVSELFNKHEIKIGGRRSRRRHRKASRRSKNKRYTRRR
jgi:hypothetical protein